MRDRFGVDVQAMHGDDGIVLRLPDLELDDVDGVRERGVGRELLDLVTLDPDDVRGLVTDEIGGSALFAARFRECAARALLLPRRRPDRRQPLWQQRQRASQLLEVASQYPTFPIVLEAVRECVQDVFDVPGLVDLMRDIGSRRVTVVDVESATPSPFAKSLLFGYVAQFLYEGDSPLAERRAAALALDPSLLAELLGTSEGLALRDLLDAEQIARTEAELQRLTPERAARDADDVLDLLRSLGPLPTDGILARCREGTTGDDVEAWLAGLDGARQVIAVRVAGEDRWAAIDDASRLRDALGVSLPLGRAPDLPRAGGRPARRPRRPLRPHPRALPRRRGGPRLRPGPRGGHHRPGPAGRRPAGSSRASCSPRAAVAPSSATPRCCACCAAARSPRCAPRSSRSPRSSSSRFLQGWQGVGGRLRGRDGLLRVVEQLSGAVLPASAVESLVLPTRVADYSPGLLDELMATGEVLWCGHGSLPGDDGWLSLHLADSAHLTLPGPDPDRVPSDEGIGGARRPGRRWRALLPHPVRPGRSTDDEALTTHPLGPRLVGPRHRRHLRPGARAARRWPHRPPAHGIRPATQPVCRSPRSARAASAPLRPGPRCPPAPARHRSPGAGRSCPPSSSTPRCGPTPRPSSSSTGTASSPAARRRPRTCPAGSPPSTGCSARPRRPGGCAAATSSKGSGASQFGTTGAVDRLRSGTGGVGAASGDRGREAPTAVVLATSDPANPYGAALPWPDRAVDPAAPPTRPTTHRPTSAAGTSRAARPAPSSCSSTASSCSTSSGAARRCSPIPTTPASCGSPPPPSRMPCAAAAWAGSPSRRPTADSCSARSPGRRRARGGRLPPHAAWSADASMTTSARAARRVSTATAALTGAQSARSGTLGEARLRAAPTAQTPLTPRSSARRRRGSGQLGRDRHRHRTPDHGRDTRGDPQLRWERALVAAAPRQPAPRRARRQGGLEHREAAEQHARRDAVGRTGAGVGRSQISHRYVSSR